MDNAIGSRTERRKDRTAERVTQCPWLLSALPYAGEVGHRRPALPASLGWGYIWGYILAILAIKCMQSMTCSLIRLLTQQQHRPFPPAGAVQISGTTRGHPSDGRRLLQTSAPKSHDCRTFFFRRCDVRADVRAIGFDSDYFSDFDFCPRRGIQFAAGSWLSGVLATGWRCMRGGRMRIRVSLWLASRSWAARWLTCRGWVVACRTWRYRWGR